MIAISSCIGTGPTTPHLARDSRGVSAVEFALVLPILILLFVGGYQLCDAISAYRKVTTTSRAIADLTSQYTSVTYNDLDMILNASVQIMSPYSPDNAVLTISQISIDKDKVATVSWSRSLNGTALTQGSAYDVPDDIRQANTSLIVSKAVYGYVPFFGSSVIGPINFGENIILSPRRSPSVVLK